MRIKILFTGFLFQSLTLGSKLYNNSMTLPSAITKLGVYSLVWYMSSRLATYKSRLLLSPCPNPTPPHPRQAQAGK